MAGFAKKVFSTTVKSKFGNYENFTKAYNNRFHTNMKLITVKSWGAQSSPNSPTINTFINVAELLGVEAQVLLEGFKMNKPKQPESSNAKFSDIIFTAYGDLDEFLIDFDTELRAIADGIRIPIDLLLQCFEEAIVNPNLKIIPVHDIGSVDSNMENIMDTIRQMGFYPAMTIDRRVLPSVIASKDLIVIKIRSDNMSPYLDKNDWAIIQLKKKDTDFDLVDDIYLISHNSNTQIKRCQFKSDGSCLLIPANKAYRDELAGIGCWDIIGKVVGRLKFGTRLS
jgi:hypothetical protein